MPVVRIGIVGAGDMGQLHAACYARLAKEEHVQIAGIASRHAARARRVARSLGVDAFTDPRDLLEDDSVEAIDVAYPSGLHRGIVTRALRAGKHVFSETPMALTARDADVMIAEARRRRRHLLVAQVMRFVGTYARLRGAVAEGEIGRPVFAEARRLSSPYWDRKRPRPFDTFGDVPLELMIHDLDLLNWILGPPKLVHATGIVGDTGGVEHAIASLECDSAVAFAEGSGLMPARYPFTTSLRVRGKKGMLDLVQRFTRGPIPRTEFLMYRDGRSPTPVRTRIQDPYLEECRHFVRVVQGRASPGPHRAEDERDALRVAEAVRDSILLGRSVRLSW